jgi:hypothetical protein
MTWKPKLPLHGSLWPHLKLWSLKEPLLAACTIAAILLPPGPISLLCGLAALFLAAVVLTGWIASTAGGSHAN